VTDRAVSIAHDSGKGRTITIAGNLGEHYHAYAFNEYRRMIENAVPGLAEPTVRVEGSGEFLEISLRRSAGGEYLLHLLNHAAIERPYARVLPWRGLRFTVALPASVKAICAARAKTEFAFERQGDAVRFAFDLEDEYEMLILRTS
jgi:hypothetical protein